MVELNEAGVIAAWPLHAMPPVKVPAVWAMYLVVANAGCATKTTPFNSTHNAGVQALNTSNFAETRGPLFNVSQ